MWIAGAAHQTKLMKRNANHTLMRRWRMLAAIAALSLIIGTVLLAMSWGMRNALQWTLITGLLLHYQLAYVYRNLNTNLHPGSAQLLPTFGAGTSLTQARGMMIAWTGGFVLSPRPPGIYAWIPMVLYTIAIIFDLLDGYAARITDHQTHLGELLDNELDALGLLVAISLAVWYQALPAWFIPVGFARYAFQLGIGIRKRTAMPIHPLSESQTRRPIAGFTMGFTSAMLWPIVSQPETTIAGVLFLLPFAFSFTRDWLVVSGGLDPASPTYQRLRAWVSQLLFRWIPLPIRGLLLFLLIGVLTARSTGWSASDLLTSQSPDTMILSIGLLAIVLGAAGRFSAFILLFPIGFAITGHGRVTELIILLVLDLAVLLLGTGAFSIWEPERQIFGRRWGAKDD
jgi:CDP-diacylglycerol--glycerol-3-phosphate 3-phosphatidyltransferase